MTDKPDIFVSLDVETTGPCPGVGELATIGAVAYHGETLEEVDRFYSKLLPASGFGDWTWEPTTKEWWWQQDEGVRLEALWKAPRSSPALVARELVRWTVSLPGKPVFVAHPVAFDWAWINDLILKHAPPGKSNSAYNPFGYRPQCLRALAWALGDGKKWGEDRTEGDGFHVPSKVPHHALHDAEAQGETMVKVLREIRRRHELQQPQVPEAAGGVEAWHRAKPW